MLLRICNYIPFIQAIAFFPWKMHRIALPKFFVLLTFNMTPILGATLFSRFDSKTSLLTNIWQKLNEAFQASDMYIFVASFISPVIYIIFERFQQGSKSTTVTERFTATIRGIFKGYGTVVFFASLLLLFTMGAYGSAKTNMENFKGSVFNFLSSKLALGIYFFSLYCWYLSILDGINEPGSFIDVNRIGESNVTEGLHARIQQQAANK